MASVHESFSLRPAVPSDAEDIAACASAAYRQYIERIGKHPGPMLEDYPRLIETRQVWVAYTEGVLAGFLVLMRTDEGFLLDNVAVDPTHSGLGIGKALIQLAEAEAKRQGHSAIYLYTHEKMTENQALYSRNGYSEYDRRAEKGYERVFMRKQL
ncbi:GNAT family N-acetyltransferase [Arhodomonas aquaeolei]|uniref:GNAT family N-acetyltransferase n=1 Tax=Arhodomonas aquaeolei TaxID=2369 RepID=UPI00216A1ED5|nr:GNAT family N-acetyltransferase [Arhodomonas aquaeolei]MCS4505623.1 GNAT family N-acetyltransferase [Arhodomonas aquaeolei]